MTTNDFDASGALSNQITQQVIAIGKNSLRFYPGRQKPQGAKPLSEISCFYPWICLIVSHVQPRCRRRSFDLLHDLCSKNQVTHFLISAPFLETNALFQSHSLLTNPNKSLLERAGPRINSRYDLKSPIFIVTKTAAISHVYLFPLSGHQRNTAVLFTSSPSLCPLSSQSRLRSASSYKHTFTLPGLGFTLPQLPIVLFKYCPVISTLHSASKALILSRFHSFNNHLIANNTPFRLTSIQSSHLAIISSIKFIKSSISTHSFRNTTRCDSSILPWSWRP